MQQHLLFSAQTPEHHWHMVSDQVMGGVSQGHMQMTEQGVNLQGHVSLENNGGFLQIQWPMNASVDRLEIQNAQGVFLEWCSHQNETLSLLIKSDQLWMPWQSYRCSAEVTTEWQTLYVPFSAFEPYRTQTRLRPQAINKFAVLAGEHEREVNVTIRQFGLYS
ncbi:MAG: CIA30 family protein [Thiotrichales bacterium]|nr:CIA30 family protein [Thiotrichales bacterium]